LEAALVEQIREDSRPIAAINCTFEIYRDARSLFGLARHWANQNQQAEGYIIIGPDSPLGIGYYARVKKVWQHHLRGENAVPRHSPRIRCELRLKPYACSRQIVCEGGQNEMGPYPSLCSIHLHILWSPRGCGGQL
jgi:hypothetical protein